MLSKRPAFVLARRGLLTVLLGAGREPFPRVHVAFVDVATVLDARITHRSGGELTAAFAGRWFRIGAPIFLALRENVARFSVAAVRGAALVEALHLMLSGSRLTMLLTGGRRALLDALEEAVDGSAEACLAVTAVFCARVEHSKRGHNAGVAALAGRNTFAVSSLIENRVELGAVASVVAATL